MQVEHVKGSRGLSAPITNQQACWSGSNCDKLSNKSAEEALCKVMSVYIAFAAGKKG